MKSNGGKQDLWINTAFIGPEGKVETDSRNLCAHALWKLNRFSAAGREPRLKRASTPAKYQVQIHGENGEAGGWRSLKWLVEKVSGSTFPRCLSASVGTSGLQVYVCLSAGIRMSYFSVI